jgi:hypothetical protein
MNIVNLRRRITRHVGVVNAVMVFIWQQLGSLAEH